MVFIEKILLMTITQHFKNRVDLRFSCPADHFPVGQQLSLEYLIILFRKLKSKQADSNIIIVLTRITNDEWKTKLMNKYTLRSTCKESRATFE